MPALYPTPYIEINNMVNQLLSNTKFVLGKQFIGLYLHGSLATGEFNPKTSDIDFVLVTNEKLSRKTISALEDMHVRLHGIDEKWAYQLEGSYIPKDDFRRYDPTDGPFPCVHEGKFYLAGHESHWIIQRYVLLKQGVIVEGPDPTTLIDPVDATEIRRAILEFLNEWWVPMLDEPQRLESPDYQAYAILTMCRILFTLENAEIASKPASANWVQQNFRQFSDLIEWALHWPNNNQQRKISETIRLIKFTVDFSSKS